MFPYSRPLVYFIIKSKPPSVFLWCHHPVDNQITSCLPWTQCVCYLHSLIYLQISCLTKLPPSCSSSYALSSVSLPVRGKTLYQKDVDFQERARIPSHYPFIILSSSPYHPHFLMVLLATPAWWE